MKVDRRISQGAFRKNSFCFLSLSIFCCFLVTTPMGVAQKVTEQNPNDHHLELVRAVRPWEFMSALGTRCGLLGTEDGNFEAWVYPLKILRNFQLRFIVDDQVIPGKAIARSITVRPEATTITYAWDTFSVRETLFSPVHEAGAIVELEVDTAQPLQIQASFDRDFQLEWPGSMGGSDIEWNAGLHAFSMTELQQKFSALVGSPSATEFHQEYVTNYSGSKENSFGLGLIPAGKSEKIIVIAASFNGLPPVETTYKKLAGNYKELLAESDAYYQDYLSQHLSVELPDAQLQQAYEWAQVSVLQGLVINPFLGTGLVAGYREAGEDQRPGYAWFFGRDALWTSLGLDAEGDFATTRTALSFLAKYQRADGKVTHEIAQGASFVPWFQGMPFAYASADATPLFIIATEDYVRRSGDVKFAKDNWDKLWRAYQFMVSTYDKTGLPRNQGVGHGWVEGGPLLPVESELYQSAVVVEALRALANIARVSDKEGESTTLSAEFDHGKALLNQAFWMPDKERYAFAIDNSGKQSDTPSVLSTVPMWFHLLDGDKARKMIGVLSQPDIQTDWGMRIIPKDSPKYEAAGYHSGTVWPLFTGWASVAEYRYHQALPAYSNLRANALLTFDGSLGHVAEVLSGNYYQTLATGSPHQIWSSAMVISPLLTGLFGLDTNALTNTITFAPHVPFDWTSFSIKHVQAGACKLNLNYRKSADKLMLDVERLQGDKCPLEFAPALSLRAQVTDVEVNGHSIPSHVQESATDEHVKIHLEIAGISTAVTVRYKNDFDLSEESNLPPLGSANQGLRLISETWNNERNQLTIDAASATGGTYDLAVSNPGQIRSVDGAELLKADAKLRIILPPSLRGETSRKSVVLHFSTENRPVKATLRDEQVIIDGGKVAQ